jgi:hypothetical protein
MTSGEVGGGLVVTYLVGAICRGVIMRFAFIAKQKNNFLKLLTGDMACGRKILKPSWRPLGLCRRRRMPGNLRCTRQVTSG